MPVQPLSRSISGLATLLRTSGSGSGSVHGAGHWQLVWHSFGQSASSVPSHCSSPSMVSLPHSWLGVGVAVGVCVALVVGVGVAVGAAPHSAG
jgi:hypothetical protein